MTDTAPKDWARVNFPNTFLGVVTEFLDKDGVVYELSGAVTCGVMESLFGPSTTTVAFEDSMIAQRFKEWFKTVTKKDAVDGIYVGPRGSLVETLPGGDSPPISEERLEQIKAEIRACRIG